VVPGAGEATKISNNNKQQRAIGHHDANLCR
jgi:hypothetical protein